MKYTKKENVPNELKEILVFLFDKEPTKEISDFLRSSELFLTWNYQNNASLLIEAHPEIYKKYGDRFADIILQEFEKHTREFVFDAEVLPDINKFHFVDNKFTPVLTQWEEINRLQENLIENLKLAKETDDFQNVGNSCRSLMQRISNIVFDQTRHTASEDIDLSEGKFKNRLHTYIKTELKGTDNKKVRGYALTLIESTEKAVDLANELTHSLNARLFIAESCVISTLSAVNIIKLIHEQV